MSMKAIVGVDGSDESGFSVRCTPTLRNVQDSNAKSKAQLIVLKNSVSKLVITFRTSKASYSDHQIRAAKIRFLLICLPHLKGSGSADFCQYFIQYQRYHTQGHTRGIDALVAKQHPKLMTRAEKDPELFRTPEGVDKFRSLVQSQLMNEGHALPNWSEFTSPATPMKSKSDSRGSLRSPVRRRAPARSHRAAAAAAPVPAPAPAPVPAPPPAPIPRPVPVAAPAPTPMIRAPPPMPAPPPQVMTPTVPVPMTMSAPTQSPSPSPPPPDTPPEPSPILHRRLPHNRPALQSWDDMGMGDVSMTGDHPFFHQSSGRSLGSIPGESDYPGPHRARADSGVPVSELGAVKAAISAAKAQTDEAARLVDALERKLSISEEMPLDASPTPVSAPVAASAPATSTNAAVAMAVSAPTTVVAPQPRPYNARSGPLTPTIAPHDSHSQAMSRAGARAVASYMNDCLSAIDMASSQGDMMAGMEDPSYFAFGPPPTTTVTMPGLPPGAPPAATATPARQVTNHPSPHRSIDL